MRTNIGMKNVVKLSREENIVAPTTLRGSPNRKIRATEVAPREKATGSRHYTTVMHAFEKIQAELKTDSNLKEIIEDIKSKIKGIK